MVSMSLCGSWKSRAEREKALAHERSFFCSAHKALLGTEHLKALLDWAATYRGRMEVLIRISKYICGVTAHSSADGAGEEAGPAYLLVGRRLSGEGPNLPRTHSCAYLMVKKREKNFQMLPESTNLLPCHKCWHQTIQYE